MEKFSFYTDGVKTIKVKDGQIPPPNFYKGRTFKSNPWNKGLSSKTNEKIKDMSEKSRNTRIKNGSYIPWNVGLTKETSDILKEVSRKNSEHMKGRVPYNKGIPASAIQKEKQSKAMVGKEPYNKGQTKATNASLLSASKKLMGHSCFVSDWEDAKKKEYVTKKLHKSFNSSKTEKDMVQNLKQEFGEDDVIAPYRDERYPFNCDAYIKSLDLFVEYNGTIEHQDHPFDPNSAEDAVVLKNLMEKASSKPHPNRYDNIIYWWTVKDPQKLKILRENNLNFKIIYPKSNIIIDK